MKIKVYENEPEHYVPDILFEDGTYKNVQDYIDRTKKIDKRLRKSKEKLEKKQTKIKKKYYNKSIRCM